MQQALPANWRQTPSLKNLLVTDAAFPLVHRDLSWLQFNDRVLEEALAPGNPLLKRLKFLSISASNLDEFFQIRFASVQKAVSLAKETEKKDETLRVRDTIIKSVRKFIGRQERAFLGLRRQLLGHGFLIHMRDKRGTTEFERGRKFFEREILPKLKPRQEDFATAMTGIGTLRTVIYFHDKLWFRIPRKLNSVYADLNEDGRIDFFVLDDLLLTHLPTTVGFRKRPLLLRISRDGDFTVDLREEDSESVPDIIRKGIGSRDQGPVTRVQYMGEIAPSLRARLLKAWKLAPDQWFPHQLTLCLSGFLAAISQLPAEKVRKPALDNAPLVPMLPKAFLPEARSELFASIRRQDMVFHYPYDSFDSYINWVEAAADDPLVTSIEQTIYRIDLLSRVVAALKRAAATKKVRVTLELRARFDELNNLQLAEELRAAGVEVGFGFSNLKLHAKMTLVTRKEGNETVRYTHLSTGNYNARTARLYTDLAILTANPEVGADARHFFDDIFRNHAPSTFQHLVTAPLKLHQRIRALIRSETQAALEGKPARIVAKVNALVDKNVIEELYDASRAGVKVDLIVRGACSLVPGIKGISDNIRVISIVDRFLEHSRIYYFQHSEAMYFCSADWMPRNFFSRLEIAFPVLDRSIFRYVTDVLLPAYFNDTEKAREFTAKGIWSRRKPVKAQAGTRAQLHFQVLAERRYAGTSIAEPQL